LYCASAGGGGFSFYEQSITGKAGSLGTLPDQELLGGRVRGHEVLREDKAAQVAPQKGGIMQNTP
jgi:hypothetical protein